MVNDFRRSGISQSALGSAEWTLHLFRARVRGVGRVRRVHVNMQTGARRQFRRITIAVLPISLTAGRGHFHPPRRLRELPGVGEYHPAFSGIRRGLGKDASRRRSAEIVADEEMYLAATGVI